MSSCPQFRDDSAKSKAHSLHTGVRLNSPRAGPAPEAVPEHVTHSKYLPSGNSLQRNQPAQPATSVPSPTLNLPPSTLHSAGSH